MKFSPHAAMEQRIVTDGSSTSISTLSPSKTTPGELWAIVSSVLLKTGPSASAPRKAIEIDMTKNIQKITASITIVLPRRGIIVLLGRAATADESDGFWSSFEGVRVIVPLIGACGGAMVETSFGER